MIPSRKSLSLSDPNAVAKFYIKDLRPRGQGSYKDKDFLEYAL